MGTFVVVHEGEMCPGRNRTRYEFTIDQYKVRRGSGRKKLKEARKIYNGELGNFRDALF